jgi:hypothetical protein
MIVSGSGVYQFSGHGGNDQFTSMSSGKTYFSGGGGADTMTGGSGFNIYQFGSEDFSANSVQGLITAADTITNWNNGFGRAIDFTAPLAGIAHLAAPVAGNASIASNGLATFDAVDTTLVQRLTAVVNAVATDAVGTSVFFNDGSDTYLFVVGDSTAGVQAGDALIKLTGISATQIQIEGGNITGF